MEDVAVVVDPYQVLDKAEEGDLWGFFGVYDGHGGRQAADYCEAKLHEVVLGELRATRQGGALLTDENVAQSIARAFHRVDDQLRLVGAWRCGCTATVALVHKTPGEIRLHVANVGDSRGVSVDSSHGDWRVSRDHRPTDIDEVRRIEAEGGFVTRGRVAGQLSVSRALGDHALKSSGVTWRPHICTRDATHDVALILASDGLWDVLSDSDARHTVEHCLADNHPERAAFMLVDDAQKRGSTDNITAMVTYF